MRSQLLMMKNGTLTSNSGLSCMTPLRLSKVLMIGFQVMIPSAKSPFWMRTSQEQFNLVILTSELAKVLQKLRSRSKESMEVMEILDV